MKEDTLTVRIDLEGENKKMFLAIKNKYNLKAKTETIRFMIKKTYDLLISDED